MTNFMNGKILSKLPTGNSKEKISKKNEMNGASTESKSSKHIVIEILKECDVASNGETRFAGCERYTVDDDAQRFIDEVEQKLSLQWLRRHSLS